MVVARKTTCKHAVTRNMGKRKKGIFMSPFTLLDVCHTAAAKFSKAIGMYVMTL